MCVARFTLGSAFLDRTDLGLSSPNEFLSVAMHVLHAIIHGNDLLMPCAIDCGKFRNSLTATRAELECPTAQPLPNDTEDAVTGAIRDLAGWLYRQSRQEFEHLNYDDAFDKTIAANAFTFTADGRRLGRSDRSFLIRSPRHRQSGVLPGGCLSVAGQADRRTRSAFFAALSTFARRTVPEFGRAQAIPCRPPGCSNMRA